MRKITDITGRLGNQMYQFAYLHCVARDLNQDGHFPHSPHWFKKYEKEIFKMFGSGIGYDDRVSIHVRRMDYVDNSIQFPLPMSYYEKAITLFPNERFLVFSDDIAWCKENFTGPRFDFSENNDEIEDLNRMASCKHNIIANSTYSTWAALLNPNPDKKVVYPGKWEQLDWQPTLPAEWIKVDL